MLRHHPHRESRGFRWGFSRSNAETNTRQENIGKLGEIQINSDRVLRVTPPCLGVPAQLPGVYYSQLGHTACRYVPTLKHVLIYAKSLHNFATWEVQLSLGRDM